MSFIQCEVTKICYQSEGSQDRQALNIRESKLHQTEANNDAVEDVPALLEVVVGIQCDQLQHHLSSEDPCEHLGDTRWQNTE